MSENTEIENKIPDKEEVVFTRVFVEDGCREIAEKIFFKFHLHQSVTISGYEMIGDTVVDKGEQVLMLLDELDTIHNTKLYGRSRRVRMRKVKANSIGGEIAQKIFRYEKRVSDGKTKTTIWRWQ